jgi:phage terminase large subunit GpA-like protein
VIATIDPLLSIESLNDALYLANAERLFENVLRFAVPTAKVPILDWCEQHFIYPTGPKKNQPYSRKDQPATSLFLQLMDDPYWRSAMLVAPNQVGKSLSLVQFVLHVNFNLREDCIFGLPNLDTMWAGKWNKDFWPAINASDLKNMLPKRGQGSDGGTPKLVKWNNGQSLMVMGGGAGDSQRAGATSRVVVVTEMKDFGDSAAGSDEGAKLDQLKNRTRSEMGREMFFGESTVTTDDNIAWKSYLEGTQTMPHFPCEGCDEHIAPEREHLVGWRDARTEEEAREKTRFSCPNCGILIDEPKRRQLLQEMIVLHKGQTVDRGKVVGEIPPTRKLSYRFTASTNMFSDAGSIGVEEWTLHHEQSTVRKSQRKVTLLQGVYGFPCSKADFLIDPLDGNVLLTRATGSEMNIVPAGYDHLFAGVDVRKSQVHFSVIAVAEGRSAKIVSWGSVRVLQDIELRQALKVAARLLQDRFRNGFQVEGSREFLPVSLTLMDSGWKPEFIEEICAGDDFWMPVKAFGAGVLSKDKYKKPTKRSSTVRYIGDDFDLKLLDGAWVVHSDASAWKTKLHEGLRVDVRSQLAITFAKASPAEVRELISHLTAEYEEVSPEAGQSTSVWIEERQENHLLDASSYANLARYVWEFMQDHLQPEDENADRFTVTGEGFLFG